MSNPKIYLVEKTPCECKEELLKRERFFIENNDCINRRLPSRTDKEYREDNKEEIKESHKKYRDEHKEIIKMKRKEKIVCDNCGALSNRSAISRHKKSKKCLDFNKET